MAVINENGRTLAGVINELKSELKEFIQTRIDMARSELGDKLKVWKMALPLIVIAVLLLVSAWLVLTASLIALVAMAFYPSPWAWFFSTLIVGAMALIGGSGCAYAAWRSFRQGVVPVRTVQVLKDDKIWLQKEAKSA